MASGRRQGSCSRRCFPSFSLFFFSLTLPVWLVVPRQVPKHWQHEETFSFGGRCRFLERNYGLVEVWLSLPLEDKLRGASRDLDDFRHAAQGISDLKPNRGVIVGVSRESQCGVTTVTHLSRNGGPPRSEGSSSFGDNHHRKPARASRGLK